MNFAISTAQGFCFGVGMCLAVFVMKAIHLGGICG